MAQEVRRRWWCGAPLPVGTVAGQGVLACGCETGSSTKQLGTEWPKTISLNQARHMRGRLVAAIRE